MFALCKEPYAADTREERWNCLIAIEEPMVKVLRTRPRNQHENEDAGVERAEHENYPLKIIKPLPIHELPTLGEGHEHFSPSTSPY